MIDNYYNSMIEELVMKLRKMVSVNEPVTMNEYVTMNLKEWNKQREIIDSIYNYEPQGKKLTIMNYYNDKLYPLLTSGIVMKQGFHKLYGVRIDNYDFKKMLSEIETLTTYQK